MSQSAATAALKIIPLGGLHEIGKNTCVFEFQDEIILLDAGLAFPTDGMHGVNIVLPDMTYLRQNREKIKGMIVTHGHEDHIGGIPFHLKQFDIPVIYGPRLAMALLQGKLEEAGVGDRTELRTVQPREMVRLGKNFLVEYIRNTHSIADSFSVAIHTPIGVIIHTGDFKFDFTPVDGECFDIQRLAEHGEKGVLCLISDSTNSEVPGHTPSERSVFPNLDRAFSQAEGRIIFTTFASSVHRLSMALELAQKHGRVVSVLGRSMLNVIAHARQLGYIHCPDDLFVPLHMMHKYPDHQVMYLTTGSQGEPLSALTRISKGEHNKIKIRPGDTVILSAHPIPGNTIAVVNMIDRLMMQGAKVIYGREQGIHVSGHACQEDQKLMLALTKPKFFLPVHGEHRMLVKHAQTAQSMGIPPENMVIIDNGDVVELTRDSIRVVDKVPAGIELLDRGGIVKAHVLQERQQLAEEGIITVAVAVGTDGSLKATPEVHLRGVVTAIEPQAWQAWVHATVETALSDRWSEYARNGDIDWAGVKAHIERELVRLVRRELQGNASVLLLLQPIEVTPTVTTGIRRRRSTASVVG
ncbi:MULTISPECIES: ribonuclease J [unclassified Thermosynechococcus]|uniref:ribonuclease J n=1 Tax=unclassified Thermosynechococcus TaxID=2622553 RepID=UPI00197F0902|nr:MULTISPECIES: ribonuclease J [unclassified Thermosynechococcus]MDR5639726.1 ribonuclease J [Thermosynechococcus sp. PP42]MDR7921608.1 ribonuclease J [Thermosynechococcus sp. HY213]QSF50117.1 ribonuclease J [Thermosynechococcus sp. TA-1]WKT82171.1 ribonuclease J [Thermosynechococcus sp. PP45]WNC25789.1 ribonuclease J [Thermosynechococcus sp. PP551]